MVLLLNATPIVGPVDTSAPDISPTMPGIKEGGTMFLARPYSPPVRTAFMGRMLRSPEMSVVAGTAVENTALIQNNLRHKPARYVLKKYVQGAESLATAEIPCVKPVR
jgi:hypothetical protein